MVPVPDARLETLARMVRPEKITPASVHFVDIAGLVRGASRGEGLGNRFLAHIREVDAVVHVVRLFTDPQVSHVEGGVDPVRDVQTVDTELCLADLETIARRLDRIEKAARLGDAAHRSEAAVLRRLEAGLNEGLPVRRQLLDAAESEHARGLHLLTARPAVYVANVAESDLGRPPGPALAALFEHARAEGAPVVVLSASFEAELAELEPADKEVFLADAGLTEPSVRALVRAGYNLLDLVTFFTTRRPELRAWTVRRGTTAVEAAGKIHTDFARGFIRAEVLSFAELEKSGDLNAAREQGRIRIEGRDYQVRDGDIIYFRFNVTSTS